MSVSIMQAQTRFELKKEPDVLVVSEGPPLERGTDTGLVYDTDADFVAGWLRKVFCTMTLGRVARRLAEHTGYLMEVDPHKPKPVQDEESLKLRLWKKMLRSVVPNKTEFVDDPEACAAHIRERAKRLKLDLEIATQGKEHLEGWKRALEGLTPGGLGYANNLVACRGYVDNELYKLRREARSATERNKKLRVGCEIPEGMSIAEYVGSLKLRISRLEGELDQQPPKEIKAALEFLHRSRQQSSGGTPLPSRLALDAARKIVMGIEAGAELGIVPSADTIAEVIDQITMLPRWQAALEGLVPSGPGFVDNPDACAKYVQDKISEIHDNLKRPVETPKEKCNLCRDRGWLLVNVYHRPSIERCGVCGIFSTDAAVIRHVAQLASDAACIAEHQKSQGL